MELECGQCGTTFTARRQDARYCSARCRVAAQRAREKAEVEALRAGGGDERLQAEVARLQAEVETLRAGGAELQAEVERLQAALRAAGGGKRSTLPPDPEALDQHKRRGDEVRKLERENARLKKLKGVDQPAPKPVMPETEAVEKLQRQLKSQQTRINNLVRELQGVRARTGWTEKNEKLLKRALHPDTNRSEELMTEAFQAFKEILGPDASTLPLK